MTYQIRDLKTKVKKTVGIYSLILLSGCGLLSDYYSGSSEPYLPAQTNWDAFNAEQQIQRLRFEERQRYSDQEESRTLGRLQAGLPPLP